MIIKFTRSCTMMCTHCLEDARPDGEHMSMEVFNNVLEFLRKVQPLVVIVGGGEPTQHPHFFEMIEALSKVIIKDTLVVASNGLFLYNQEMTQRMIDLNVGVQITNDVRYYPFSINHVEHPNFKYETRIRSLFPQGRAVENGYNAINKTAPSCFNLRSIGCNPKTPNLSTAIRNLELHQKFCAPSIGVHGEVLLGESSLCGNIGYVTDKQEDLFNRIKTFKCNRCKMEDGLSVLHKLAINAL